MFVNFPPKTIARCATEIAQGHGRCVEKAVNHFSSQIDELSKEVKDLPDGVTKLFAKALIDTLNTENNKYQALLIDGKKIYTRKRMYNHMEQEAKKRNIIKDTIEDLKNILYGKK